MDGDHSGKTFDSGASSGLKSGAGELADGIHENAKQTAGAGEKMTGQGTSMFSKDGAVGSMFNADGALGGTAQKIGGPLDKQGMVGKHFNADGAVGGAVQKNIAEGNSDH